MGFCYQKNFSNPTLPEKLAILDEENELAKNALIENYIIESV